MKLYHFYTAVLNDGSRVFHWLERFFQDGDDRYADTAAMVEGGIGFEVGPIAIQELAEEVPAHIVAERCPKSYKALLEWIGGNDPHNPPSSERETLCS